MTSNEGLLKEVWNQKAIPVVLRRIKRGQLLRIRIPYAEDNRQWLQDGRQNSLEWVAEGRYWELPKAWFNDFVERALGRYRRLYVIQPYREQEVCAHRCMNATGHECQCSCMGANHGVGNDGTWFEESETFATRWHHEELACRLMVAKSDR